MNNDPIVRLEDHLTSCEIPLSEADWITFQSDLKTKGLENFYQSWKHRKSKWFKWRCNSGLDEKHVKDSLVLALFQNNGLKSKAEARECVSSLGPGGKDKEVAEFMRNQANKNRDLKPTTRSITQNWLEPMPVFNEGTPCGYVQATGQRRQKIENFLRINKAKPTKVLATNKRGKPKSLYRFETNCLVLDQWFGKWCNQDPETKHELILREALVLAEVIADSKNPVSDRHLARLRRIFKSHARSAGRRVGADFDYDLKFLDSPTACIEQINRLREESPPTVVYPGPFTFE